MTKKTAPTKNSVRERHKDLWLILLIAVACISLVPTTLLAILSYYQYQHLLVEKQDQHLRQYADLIAQTLLPLADKTTEQHTTHRDRRFAVQLPAEFDIFIVDKNGLICSPSTLFSAEEGATLQLNSYQKATTVQTVYSGGQQILITGRPLPNSNETLIIAQVAPVKTWYAFQFKLVVTFLFATTIGLLLIYQLIKVLTRKLRESDIQRMKVFSDIAHSHRLTTLGKLATGVAHEINNPLAALHQRTGLLHDILDAAEHFPQQEKLRKTTDQMLSHIKRCQIITHQLLLLAEDRQTSNNKQTNVNDLIAELLIFFQEESEIRRISFETNLAPQLPVAHGEEDKIQQVLLTIITNAMTAIGKDGTIQINTETNNNDYIKINIEDNGHGIPPNVLKHIFDPFFSTKDTGEGTGLGLAIAHGLIKSLGGEITIENMVTRGTRSSILLLSDIDNNENTNN